MAISIIRTSPRFAKIWSSNATPLLLNVFFFIIVAFLLLSLYPNDLFNGLDGVYMKELLLHNWVWSSHTSTGMGMNLLQGMGDINFTWLSNLDPVIILTSPFRKLSFAATLIYILYSIEYFLSGYLLCRIFKINRDISFVGAWLITLLAMPMLPRLHGVPIFYSFLRMVPQMSSCFFFSILFAFCFQQTGERKGQTLLFWTLTSFLGLYIMLCFNIGIILIIPFLLFFLFFDWAFSKTGQVKLIKLSSLSFIFIVLLFTNYFYYMRGLFSYTVTSILPESLVVHPNMLTNASSLFLYPVSGIFPASSFLVLCGIIGMMISAIQSKGETRRYAIIVLAFVFCLLMAGLGVALTSFHYLGPDILYFEIIIWPLFAGYTVLFLAHLYSGYQLNAAKFFKKQHGEMIRANDSQTIFALVKYIILPVLLIFTALKFNSYRSDTDYALHHFKKTAVIRLLQHNIGLRQPGNNFNGYVATFTPTAAVQKGVDWGTQHGFDMLTLLPRTGNDYRSVGLWHYQIPTLFEYNPLLSPALFFLNSKTMSRTIDLQMRNVTVITKPNINLLAALGVRYIISSEQYSHSGLDFIQFESYGDKNESVYLYEIKNANLATFHPSKFYALDSVASFLKRIKKSQVDFTQEAYLQKEMNLPGLVSPKQVQIKAIQNGIELSADSDGFSTILLPLLYSNCLQVKHLDGDASDFQMVRANLVETLLVFNKKLHVNILYNAGLFKQANCRYQDAMELKSIVKKDTAV